MRGFFILLFVLLCPGVLAQEKPSKDQKVKQIPQKIFLDKIEVEGWIEKPQTIYIVPGSDPKVDDIKIDRTFIEEILMPLDKDTFEKKIRAKLTPPRVPW